MTASTSPTTTSINLPGAGTTGGNGLPQLTGRAWLGLLVTAGLLALSWKGTFSDMWLRWFPAWERMADASLMDRLTKGDSYYSHGPLVGLTSLILCYFIYQRVGVPAARTMSSAIVGWSLLIVSLLLHLMSVYARVMFVSGFSLIGVLAGLALLWGGWSLLRAYWLPVLVLFFMVPLPEVAVGELNFRLKGIASDAAVWATNAIMGIPAIKDGSYVFLPPATPDGPPKMLVVENVCSGLRSLISLTFFAALFAMVCRVRGFWRVMMLLLAVPVAVLCNVIRITSLNVVAHYFSVDEAGEDGWFHGFSGMVVFLIALGLLFALEQLIIVGGRFFKRNWTDPRLLGYLDALPKMQSSHLTVLKPMVLVTLAVVVGLSMLWGRETAREHRGAVAAQAVPETVLVGEQTFTGESLILDQQTLTILETDDYLCRLYRAPQQLPFELLIVFSADNRKGTHPPDVCLEGSGEKILTKDRQWVPLAGGRELAMKELVTQYDNRLSYHLFVYKCGDRYTTSFFTQQATIFANGLLARNTAGALIRVTVLVPGTDVNRAREQAMAAAGVLMPIIDANLP